MDALKSLDMRWLRMDITWDRVEREKGVYDFSQVDKLIETMRKRAAFACSPSSIMRTNSTSRSRK